MAHKKVFINKTTSLLLKLTKRIRYFISNQFTRQVFPKSYQGGYVMDDTIERDQCMLSIDTDPLEKTHGVRVPEITKEKIDKLSRVQKRQLNDEILQTIDSFLHRVSYVPGRFLKKQD